MTDFFKDFSRLIVFMVGGLSALFVVQAMSQTSMPQTSMPQTSMPQTSMPQTSASQAEVTRPGVPPQVTAAQQAVPQAPTKPAPAHTAPTPAAPGGGGATAAATTADGKPISLAEIIEDYTYNPVGKRDPFAPYERPTESATMGPLWPLQKFDLDQLKLVGIIWEVKEPKAMILDPVGKGYVVKVNERIGRNNGYIARIREGEIIIVESYTAPDGTLNYSTKLMKLRTD